MVLCIIIRQSTIQYLRSLFAIFILRCGVLYLSLITLYILHLHSKYLTWTKNDTSIKLFKVTEDSLNFNNGYLFINA